MGDMSIDTAAQAKPVKVRILEEVAEIVGKRGLNYGTPEDNFERIARRWAIHLKNRYGIDILIDDIDVAAMCVDLKLARLENEPCHMDSWKDICGYGACGGEIAQHHIDRTWADAAAPTTPDRRRIKVGDQVGAFNTDRVWRHGPVVHVELGCVFFQPAPNTVMMATEDECVVILPSVLKSENQT